MRLIHALLARLLEGTGRRASDVADDGALAVERRSVIRVLMVCDDRAWGLGLAAATRVIRGCFEKHFVD